MRALAIDTSTSMAGIAVADEKELLAEYMISDKKTHSEKLMPMLKELLGSLKISIKDIDVFAAVTGPGSFTGLRIGVTTIKTLAYSENKPVAGITSLDALANVVASFPGSIICPMINARNDQVYTALYDNNEGVKENLTGYMGMHISELASRIEGYDRNVIFTGDGVNLHNDYFKNRFGDRCTFIPNFLLQQMASSAARLALTLAQKGETISCFDLVPFYLRPSQAEREFGRKNAPRE